MKALLLSEWYKLRYSKAPRVVYFGTLVMAAFTVWLPFVFTRLGLLSGRTMARGQDGLGIIGAISPFLVVCFIAFVGFFVAAEFPSGVARNTLSLGKGRVMLVFSKFCAAFGVLLLMLLSTAIVSVGSLSVINGFGDVSFARFSGRFALTLFTQGVFHLPYVSVFCLLAFITKNTGITIICGVAYMIVIAVVRMVWFFEAPNLTRIFPEYYIAALGQRSDDWPFVRDGLIVSSLFTAIPCVIGCGIFQKADMKF